MLFQKLSLLGLSSVTLISAFGSRAEIVQTLNIRLVGHTTVLSTNIGTVHSAKMKAVRISTKTVLDMLAVATTSDFAGGTLVVINRGDAYQVRRGTNILADVTPFFTVQGFSQDVIDQTIDRSTGKDFYHGFWLRTLAFDDHQGNSFTLNGLVEERYIATAADAASNQKVTDTEILTGSGSGALGGQFALFSGTLSATGTGIMPFSP